MKRRDFLSNGSLVAAGTAVVLAASCNNNVTDAKK